MVPRRATESDVESHFAIHGFTVRAKKIYNYWFITHEEGLIPPRVTLWDGKKIFCIEPGLYTHSLDTVVRYPPLAPPPPPLPLPAEVSIQVATTTHIEKAQIAKTRCTLSPQLVTEPPVRDFHVSSSERGSEPLSLPTTTRSEPDLQAPHPVSSLKAIYPGPPKSHLDNHQSTSEPVLMDNMTHQTHGDDVTIDKPTPLTTLAANGIPTIQPDQQPHHVATPPPSPLHFPSPTLTASASPRSLPLPEQHPSQVPIGEAQNDKTCVICQDLDDPEVKSPSQSKIDFVKSYSFLNIQACNPSHSPLNDNEPAPTASTNSSSTVATKPHVPNDDYITIDSSNSEPSDEESEAPAPKIPKTTSTTAAKAIPSPIITTVPQKAPAPLYAIRPHRPRTYLSVPHTTPSTSTTASATTTTTPSPTSASPTTTTTTTTTLSLPHHHNHATTTTTSPSSAASPSTPRVHRRRAHSDSPAPASLAIPVQAMHVLQEGGCQEGTKSQCGCIAKGRTCHEGSCHRKGGWGSCLNPQKFHRKFHFPKLILVPNTST
ncbi:hypothetical protein Pelo_17998 [Pelomyxa schiedti]|nr:hypothetical protein Pelo_17998 [Pelomyxa schiedti]